MPAVWRIELLGRLRAVQPGRVVERFRSSKIGGLLAYLATYAGREHAREELIELFWPDAEPSAGRQSLSQALSSLRNQLEPPGIPSGSIIRATRSAARIDADAVFVDVREFESLFETARRAPSDFRRERALDQAVSLYKGEFLPGHYADWALRIRERLAERFLEAIGMLRAAAEARGDQAAALECARRATQVDPLHEESHRELMRLLAASGDATAARRQYTALRSRLRRELEQDPEPATTALARRIIEGSASVVPKERRRSPRRAPPVPPPTRPAGTMTFLAASWGGHGATAARRAFGDLAGRLRAAGGIEVLQSPTESVHAFHRTADALVAAVPLLREAAAIPANPEATAAPASPGPAAASANPGAASPAPPALRLAIHTGDVEPGRTLAEDRAVAHAIELVLAARGGQLLCSDASAALLRRHLEHDLAMEDLGIHLLRDGRDPERVFLIRIPECAGGPRRSLHASRAAGGNLPLLLTRFFGRERDLQVLESWLDEPAMRIATVTGPGGMGKTRLVVELAKRRLTAFPGGLCFVPLADLSDPREIPRALLDALRLPPDPRRDPLDQVAEAFGASAVLVVLDNLEHLAAEGARIVRSLLERLPTCRFLVTSRARLNLAGEREYPLGPLPVPGEAGSPEQLIEVPGVRLFVDRAQVLIPDFQLTKGNAEAVALLCVRLEGIPLAIELAAARIQLFTPAQMVRRMRRRFDLLAGGPRDGAARHRTLRTAIDWSYHLLPPDVQRFFAEVSVFPESWTVEAAEAVTGEALALDHLTRLRESSLLQVQASAGEARFRMLDTIRAYAVERLDADTGVRLARRHAEFYAALAEQAAPHLQSRARATWMERLALERENLAQAFRSLEAEASRDGGAPVAGPSPLEQGLRLATALTPFWQIRGEFREGAQYLRRFLALAPERSSPLCGRALHEAGFLELAQGRYAEATGYLDRSLEIACRCGDRDTEGRALNSLGNVAFYQGDYVTARQRFETCLEIRRERGERLQIARLLHNLGNIANARSEYENARALLEQSLDMKREFDDPWDMAGTLQSLGNVAANRGDYAAARACYASSLAARREVGDRQGIAYVLGNLALVTSAEGDPAEAEALHQESLAIKRDLGDKRGIAGSLHNLGGVARRRGDYARAARLTGAAVAHMERIGAQLPPVENTRYLGIVADLEQKLGANRFRTLFEAGRLMGEKDAIELALQRRSAPSPSSEADGTPSDDAAQS